MAQKFINCAIVEPNSFSLPDGFASGLADSDLLYVGLARGWGENVYRVVSNAVGLSLGTTDTYTQGDLLVKYRLWTAIEIPGPGPNPPALAFDQNFSVDIGDAGGNGWRFDDQFHAATQQFRVRGTGRNQGTDATVNIPAAAAVATYRGPRYMRINWTSAGVLRAKVWQYDKAEPSSWQHAPIGQAVTSASPVNLIVSSAYECSLDLHWVAISDTPSEPAYKATVAANDTTTFPGGSKTVALRRVVDSANMALANAVVRLYHQSTGAFLGSGTTDAQGMVSITGVNTDALCYAIVTRPAGGDIMESFLNRP